MSEVKAVFVQTRPVQGPQDLGQTFEGYYTRDGDTITLVHPDGVPLRRSRNEKWQVRIGEGENEKAVAKGLLRRMWNTEHPNGRFWQDLPYRPPSTW
jgi:hypothetical protein